MEIEDLKSKALEENRMDELLMKNKVTQAQLEDRIEELNEQCTHVK